MTQSFRLLNTLRLHVQCLHVIYNVAKKERKKSWAGKFNTVILRVAFLNEKRWITISVNFRGVS